MTTHINPNGYAVVWYDDDGTPKVCTGMVRGVEIDGKTYGIFDSAEAATAEFMRWPHDQWRYGIVPASQVVEERPRYVLKASALG